ncbi:TniQ family protein, partial [Vibrio anguillarum]
MFNVSWPMHPQPLPDEIFSSWMARAAVCNGEGLSRFIKLTIPELRAIDKSIDNFLSETMIKRVSTKMNTSFRCVHQTT